MDERHLGGKLGQRALRKQSRVVAVLCGKALQLLEEHLKHRDDPTELGKDEASLRKDDSQLGRVLILKVCLLMELRLESLEFNELAFAGFKPIQQDGLC